jgi:hypothetical protein
LIVAVAGVGMALCVGVARAGNPPSEATCQALADVAVSGAQAQRAGTPLEEIERKYPGMEGGELILGWTMALTGSTDDQIAQAGLRTCRTHTLAGDTL